MENSNQHSSQPSIPGAERSKSKSWENFKCKSKRDEDTKAMGQPFFVHLDGNFKASGYTTDRLEGELIGIGCNKWWNKDEESWTYNFLLFIKPQVLNAKILRAEFTFSMYSRGILSRIKHLVDAGAFIGGYPALALQTYPRTENIKYPGVTMFDATGKVIPYGISLDDVPEPRVIADPQNPERIIKRIYEEVDKFYANLIGTDLYPVFGEDNPGRMKNLGENEGEYMSRLKKKWGMTSGPTENEVSAGAAEDYPDTTADPVPAAEEADDDLPF